MMRRLMTILMLAAMLPVAGCVQRSGTAFIEIINEQNPADGKAVPIMIDPRVEVVANEYRISFFNEGSNIRQHITIKGPVMIVPAPAHAIPTTRPAQ